MGKRLLPVILLLLCCGCNMTTYRLYNHDKSNGLDFSKGKWLIGEIETNKTVKEELTKLVIADFTAMLGERVKYSLTEKSLLLSAQNPLQPNKYQIEQLKKSTGFDYFINIKSKNGRNDRSNFDYTEHNYVLLQLNVALVTVEVYDLNQGTIVYSQTASGRLDEDNSFTMKPTQKVILGSYRKVINDIRQKSIVK